MLTYTAGNFNENPSMRAFAKILRARASEHSSNFCEQFEQRPSFASTFKFSGWDHSIPLAKPDVASSLNIRYLLTGSKGNSEFCFSETLNVSRGEPEVASSRRSVSYFFAPSPN